MAASSEHAGPETQTTTDPDPDQDPDQDMNQDQELTPNQDPDPDSDSDPDGSRVGSGPRARSSPQDIRLEAAALSVALHPTRDVLVCGDVDGDVYAYSYSCTEENRELWSSGHHRKSCRQVRVSGDGLRVCTVSRDRAVHVLDLERGQLVTRIRGAHQAPINTLLLLDPNLMATGDDQGTLKVWDLRKGSDIMDLKNHEDYISDITVDQDQRTLYTTSGDGTLGVFQLRRRRFQLGSEVQRADLTSAVLMKRDRKVVVGSADGCLILFNRNGPGAASDRFHLKAESIDTMTKLSENVLVTGSTDGYIRAVHLFPNRVLGCVGQHVGEPIEEVSASSDGRLLVSSAHDQLLKFWDVSEVGGAKVEDYKKRKRRDGKMKALSKKAHGERDFFSGLREEEEKEKEEKEEED